MLLLLLRLVSLLPLPLLHALGRVLGVAVYALPGRYRQRLRANAAQAGYTDPAFLRRSAAEMGALVMEVPKIWFRQDEALARASIADPDILAAAQAEKRGILFVTPHLGSFDISARLVARTMPLTVMFRVPRQHFLRGVTQAARNTSTMRAVPADRQGVREFVRALRRGEGVGMLPDQVPAHDGVWAPVFGRPAYTVMLPGKLAQQANSPILMAAAERLPRGQGWRLHFERVPEPLPDAPEDQAALINATMEKMIRRFPEQYLWSYNRYKTPKHLRDAASTGQEQG